MSLIQDVIRLVGEFGGATADDIAPRLPGFTRDQIKQALQNAKWVGKLRISEPSRGMGPKGGKTCAKYAPVAGVNGRPVGDNMTRICEVVEDSGPIAPFEIAELSGLRHNMVRAYVCRAFDRGMRIREGRKYVAADNWRAVAGLDKPVEPARPMPANSVFQWAQV